MACVFLVLLRICFVFEHGFLYKQILILKNLLFGPNMFFFAFGGQKNGLNVPKHWKRDQ